MTSRNPLIFLLGVAGSFFSFQGCNCDIQCSKAEINFDYVGFDSLSLDTVIIRRFDKTTSANRLKDTILLGPENISYRFLGDTARWSTVIKPGMFPFLLLQSDWNYEVFIPAAGKTYQVTDILESQTSRNVPCYSPTMQKKTCMNTIYSITVDGGPASIDGYRIYLVK